MKKWIAYILLLLIGIVVATDSDAQKRLPRKRAGGGGAPPGGDTMEFWTYYPAWAMGGLFSGNYAQICSLPYADMPSLSDIVWFPHTGMMGRNATPYLRYHGGYVDSLDYEDDSLDYFYYGHANPGSGWVTWQQRGWLDTMLFYCNLYGIRLHASTGNNAWSDHKMVDSCQATPLSTYDADYSSFSISTDFRHYYKACSVYVSAGASGNELMVYKNVTWTSSATTIDTPWDGFAFWIKPSIQLDSPAIGVLVDDDDNCASPYDTIYLKTLPANEWTEVFPYMNDTATVNRDTVESFGLMQVGDLGAFNFKIDDIRAVQGTDAVYYVMADSVRSHTFARGVWEFVERHDFDGFETDFEGSSSIKPDTLCINRFYKLLAQERDAAEVRQGRDYKLIVTTSPTWSTRYPALTRSTYADRILLMAYTNSPFWWSTSANPAPPDGNGNYIGVLGGAVHKTLPGDFDHSVYGEGEWDSFNYHVLIQTGWGPYSWIANGTPANRVVSLAPAYAHLFGYRDTLWSIAYTPMDTSMPFTSGSFETARWRGDWLYANVPGAEKIEHDHGAWTVAGTPTACAHSYYYPNKIWVHKDSLFLWQGPSDTLFYYYAKLSDSLGCAGVGLYDISTDFYYSPTTYGYPARQYMLYHLWMDSVLCKKGWSY